MIEHRYTTLPEFRIRSFASGEPVRERLPEPIPMLTVAIKVQIGFHVVEVDIDVPMDASCNHDKAANAARLVGYELQGAFARFLTQEASDGTARRLEEGSVPAVPQPPEGPR